MQKLTIRKQIKNNTTIIENEFIDTYMPKANGEFIKVYLYLLRHLNTQDANITLTHIADSLENTERDIMRALKYWEKEGLLIITYDASDTICGIDIATISLQNVGATPNTQLIKTSSNLVTPKEIIKPEPVKSTSTKSRKEFKQLLFMTEQYLGKTLSKSDMDMISYFCETLHFSIPLIEFLVEYCVENGHYSMHYIQSVALAWFDQGIQTVDAAKNQISSYSKEHYTVLKAFGITERNPVAAEKQFIKKWAKEMGFSMEIILEACARTMSTIHKPSFEYTDTILNNWKTKNVVFLADLDKLDKLHEETKKNPTVSTNKSPSIKTNTFNNFTQRNYDFDNLEKQLLNVQ